MTYLDDSLDSVFDIEPRLVIDEARAEEELSQLGEELDVFLDGLPHITTFLPPQPLPLLMQVVPASRTRVCLTPAKMKTWMMRT